MEDPPTGSVPRGRSPGKAAAILVGARHEFLRQGYAATSMDRVASAAGVSKATVYAHYGDKETLFHALTRQMVEERLLNLFGGSPREALPTDPHAALAELAARCLDRQRRQPDFLSFLRLVIGESGRFPQLAREFVTQLEGTALAQVVDLFASLAREAAAGGAGAAPIDAEMGARIFMGALVHLILVQDLLHGSEVVAIDRERFAAALIGMVERTIAPQPSETSPARDPPRSGISIDTRSH